MTRPRKHLAETTADPVSGESLPAAEWNTGRAVAGQTVIAGGLPLPEPTTDVDADAEMQIYMTHAYTFTAADFIL